jgi:ribosome-dependent ATPase
LSATAAAAESPVVTLAGLSHRYGATRALDGIELTLPAGRAVGLIGPDGVGKSTLLGLVAGARRVQQGRVHVLGGDLREARHRRAACARIAYMPQGLGGNLYPDLSVAENADFFARLFGLGAEARAERAAELFAATGLAAFRDRRARNLSGGMKQKLGLCCALIHEPELLILDEPTTGVDPLSRRQFWELIERMRTRRPALSVLVATAYMEEAEGFDWLVLLDAGRVLATGTPAELEAQADAESLEEAYVALLPAERRRGHRGFSIAPRAPGEGEPAIEAEGLVRRFGDFTAVDGVSFRIARGEIFGFLGPNGCGKSTTMKMLTGLLPASEGTSRLFGRPVDARDRELRRRIGYMSQSFSLYGELTVRQNLVLHGQLFGLGATEIARRLDELLDRFELAAVLDQCAADLPLGVRQRLSLAVAVFHQPELLILDEPTSGVDPVARDRFWELLGELSRDDGVTIFVSTHFLNEGARCDRIALMNAGRVLACDAPSALIEAQDAETLEDAFVAYIAADERTNEAETEPVAEVAPTSAGDPAAPAVEPRAPRVRRRLQPGRLLAVARRELLELRRDRIRLAMSLVAPLVLLVVLGYGISFDVENLPYAVLDRDRTPESRAFLDQLAGSISFAERPAANSSEELERRLRAGELRVSLQIPAGFGRDLQADRSPEIAVWLDGAMPFRAETARGYLRAIEASYRQELARARGRTAAQIVRLVPRFRYNQELRSANAVVPGVLAIVLALVPTMLMAVAVVREKELGSIVNFQTTPLRRAEFLLGKQLPYIAVSFVSFLTLVALALSLFRVPFAGSFGALALGALLYVWATTGLGLLVSAFTRTQIAAIIAAAVLTILPTVQFSGLTAPVSSLTGAALAMGRGFPASWFHRISVGAFTKGLTIPDLGSAYLVLIGFAVGFALLGLLLLRKQQP